ncbi:MAG: hypothetical protein LC105_13170 [Chitinophagales bacterium]|nr:hypothetical protein [Chitinophagales bacterium]MCZ2394807.1 hypothetical protein [Chitinophagales bacterium]
MDTCRVYENVSDGTQTTQYLRKIYLFNGLGNIAQEVEFGVNEYDGHTIIKYEYNSNGLISRKQILRPERDPIEYIYYNSGNKWLKMSTIYPYPKDYEIQSNEQGLILGILGKAMVPERDSLTGELTGKEIYGTMEEYEYRYNRFYKVVKETYYYLGRDIHTITYQYPPNGYGLPLSMSYFKEDSKTPEYTIIYTYDPHGFLHMEVNKDITTGYTNTLEYEYSYHYDSPIHEQQPEMKKGQQFWIGKKK